MKNAHTEFRSRARPSNNIAIIAYLLHNDDKERDISVIQVFSPHYYLESGTSAKMDVSKFLGKILLKEILGHEYHPILIEGYTWIQFNEIYTSFIPETKTDKKNIATLEKMAEEVADKISKIM